MFFFKYINVLSYINMKTSEQKNNTIITISFFI